MPNATHTPAPDTPSPAEIASGALYLLSEREAANPMLLSSDADEDADAIIAEQSARLTILEAALRQIRKPDARPDTSLLPTCSDDEPATFAELADWMDDAAIEQERLAKYCESIANYDDESEHIGAQSALLECAEQVRRLLPLDAMNGKRLETVAQLVALGSDNPEREASNACDVVEWIGTHLEGWGVEIPTASEDAEGDYHFAYADGRAV